MIKCIIFHHIHKCAGVTVRNILQRNCDGYYNIDSPKDWFQIDQILKEKENKSDSVAVAGHYTWGIQEQLQNDFEILNFTILRDPWSIFISHYSMRYQKYYEYNCIEEFFENYLHNPLVKFLGNGDLSLARKRLFKHFDLFGIVEYFDLFISRLSKILEIQIPNYSNKNISNSKQFKIDNSIERLFNDKNQEDIILYEEARNFFLKGQNRYDRKIIHSREQDCKLSFVDPISKEIHRIRKTSPQPAPRIVNYLEVLPEKEKNKKENLVALAQNYQICKEYWKAYNYYLKLAEIDSKFVINAAKSIGNVSNSRALKLLLIEQGKYKKISSTIEDSRMNLFKNGLSKLVKTYSVKVIEPKKIKGYSLDNLDAVTKGVQRVLVVRSAPIKLLYHIMDKLLSINFKLENIDCLIQESVSGQVGDRYKGVSVHVLENGMFDFEKMNLTLFQSLLENRYDAAIILSNSENKKNLLGFFNLLNKLAIENCFMFNEENINNNECPLFRMNYDYLETASLLYNHRYFKKISHC